MKVKDIKNFEIGEHCFGEILKINGKDYKDLKKEDVIDFINDMFENNVNSENLIRETLKVALEYLQYNCIEEDTDSCDQCGNFNYYNKYSK